MTSNKNNAQTVASLALQANMNLQNTDAPSLVSVPEGYTLKNTEGSQEYRNRFRGTFTTKSLKGFADYVSQRKGGADKCFVDNTNVSHMSCQAIFNLGDEALAGHADDTANLVLNITNEFAALRKHQRLSQKDLIDFVQDYAYCLSFNESVDGEIGEKMSIGNAINAFRSVTIKTAREMTSDVRDMSSTKSALEHIEADSAVQLPGFIVMNVPAYDDLPVVEIKARLSVITDDDSVRFGVRIIGENKLLKDSADFFIDLIEDVLPAETPIYAGIFAA